MSKQPHACLAVARRRSLGIILSSLAALSVPTLTSAQEAGLKTNLIGDALLNPNLALEIGLAPRWTLDVSGQMNLWTVGNGHKWRHWVVQPEARYWFCQSFAGHFLGFHALGGQYNVGNLDMNFKFLGTDFSKLKDRRYEGWGIGAGVAYGYAWPLSRHWNLEAEVGFGWIWTKSNVFPCGECGSEIQHGKVHNYVGPTKLALNIEYVF